ncbi:MAG: HAD family phosphatase [Lachnospiraceae bacterium]|jgi:16S rRNA pseudouridine516 synthase|nr:HAD family phosphatase [Lachnospiraceae bacterium]
MKELDKKNIINDIDALLFDLDGTLVDSMWVWKEIDFEYLKQYGATPPENIEQIIEGMSFTETATYFKEVFALPEDVETIKDEWNRLAWEKYTTQVPMKPGVMELLHYARDKGLKMGIATSNSIELVEQIVTVHDLKQFFPVIMTSCEVERGKPAPDIYLAVAAALKVAPARCLVFEDIVPGIEAGKSAGMRVCAVEDAYSAATREEKQRLADYYIMHYNEIAL